MMRDKIKIWTGEFLRYLVAGGTAFLVDFFCLWLGKTYLFRTWPGSVYWATAFGVMVGLFVNHILVLAFVFRQPEDIGKGRSLAAWGAVILIGISGLALTELGMWIGVALLEWNYLIVKILVTGAVLFYNFLIRKVTIFR